jgi:hypothetical protein
MATPLTKNALTKALSQNQKPQLVLKIHGYDHLIGLGNLSEYILVGDEDLVIGNGWVIGGLRDIGNALDVIDIKGSSRTLSQQIQPDKGSGISIPSFQVSLIDINEKITQLISPSVVFDDILGRRADLYLGYQETAYPQDFVRIISGIIDRVDSGATIGLNIAHPEQKKRAELFAKMSTVLTQAARYRSRTIQGLTYKTRRDVVTTVTVNYVGGGTAGAEVVSVVGTNITVQIQAGVSTASNVRNALEKSIDALALITINVVDGNILQALQPVVNLDSDVTIEVETTAGFLTPAPAYGLRTYLRIEDEVLEYTGLTATQFTGCVRGALSDKDARAEGAHHDAEESVESFYRLEGDAITMALRLLMSDGIGGNSITDVEVKDIGDVEGVSVANAVYFFGVNVARDYGVTVLDKASIILDPIPANNVTDAEITDVVGTEYGSYIILDAPLSLSLNTPATISFKSKYNVLPEGAGLGLTGEEVDTPRFEEIKERFASTIFTYDFYLKDTKEAFDFIDREILFTTGAYTIPRLGKTSVAYTSPPLGLNGVLQLDEDSTSEPQSNKITRSINRYFYNAVVFAFNDAVVDDRYLSGDVNADTESRARIKVGSRPLSIECGGIRPTVENLEIIRVLRDRFKEKYRFGAEVIEIKAMYGKSFNADVGDVALFGSGLNLVDSKNGSRTFASRLWDVLNKSITPITGEVKLTLIDSAYSLGDARYGVISPSSLCGSGSTTSSLKLKSSYDLEGTAITEAVKWRDIVGVKLIVHTEDWAVWGETFLTAVSPSDPYTLQVDPPLAFAALDNYIVDVAPYPDNDIADENAIGKAIYVFTDPTVEITSGVSNTSFNVLLAEADLFLEGAALIVHNDDYTILSPEVKVLSVVGTLVTVNKDLTFTPSAGHEVELIGYKDGGAPYRYL